PVAVLLLRESRGAELLNDRRKESRRDREIKKAVSGDIVLLFRVNNLPLQALERLRILKLALDVIDALGKPIPYLQVDGLRREFRNLFTQNFAERFRGVIVHRESHDCELFGEQILLGEIDQRGDEFALGQISGDAEDDHDTRRGL